MNTLTKANEIITGPRRESYGPVVPFFERAATVWSGLLSNKLKEPLTSVEVTVLMSAFKLCREMNSHHEDNFIDANGYNELGNQCAQGGNTSDDPILVSDEEFEKVEKMMIEKFEEYKAKHKGNHITHAPSDKCSHLWVYTRLECEECHAQFSFFLPEQNLHPSDRP